MDSSTTLLLTLIVPWLDAKTVGRLETVSKQVKQGVLGETVSKFWIVEKKRLSGHGDDEEEEPEIPFLLDDDDDDDDNADDENPDEVIADCKAWIQNFFAMKAQNDAVLWAHINQQDWYEHAHQYRWFVKIVTPSGEEMNLMPAAFYYAGEDYVELDFCKKKKSSLTGVPLWGQLKLANKYIQMKDDDGKPFTFEEKQAFKAAWQGVKICITASKLQQERSVGNHAIRLAIGAMRSSTVFIQDLQNDVVASQIEFDSSFADQGTIEWTTFRYNDMHLGLETHESKLVRAILYKDDFQPRRWIPSYETQGLPSDDEDDANDENDSDDEEDQMDDDDQNDHDMDMDLDEL